MAEASVRLSEEDLRTLTEARARSLQLLEELRQRQVEMEGSGLSPEKLAEGRAAMQKAIAAAERMIDNLDKALQLARGPLN